MLAGSHFMPVRLSRYVKFLHMASVGPEPMSQPCDRAFGYSTISQRAVMYSRNTRSRFFLWDARTFRGCPAASWRF